jgi:hypothetical protein
MRRHRGCGRGTARRQAASASPGATSAGRRGTVRARSSRAPRTWARSRSRQMPSSQRTSPSRSSRRAARAACLHGTGSQVRYSPGAAAAAEPQVALVDLPEHHAVAPGMRLGLHQDRAVRQHPGVVALLHRTNFRSEPVEAASLIDIEHFFHAPSIGQGCDKSQRNRSSDGIESEGTLRWTSRGPGNSGMDLVRRR